MMTSGLLVGLLLVGADPIPPSGAAVDPATGWSETAIGIMSDGPTPAIREMGRGDEGNLVLIRLHSRPDPEVNLIVTGYQCDRGLEHYSQRMIFAYAEDVEPILARLRSEIPILLDRRAERCGLPRTPIELGESFDSAFRSLFAAFRAEHARYLEELRVSQAGDAQ